MRCNNETILAGLCAVGGQEGLECCIAYNKTASSSSSSSSRRADRECREVLRIRGFAGEYTNPPRRCWPCFFATGPGQLEAGATAAYCSRACFCCCCFCACLLLHFYLHLLLHLPLYFLLHLPHCFSSSPIAHRPSPIFHLSRHQLLSQHNNPTTTLSPPRQRLRALLRIRTAQSSQQHRDCLRESSRLARPHRLRPPFITVMATNGGASGGMKPVQISEVRGNSRENRTAAHSHIKGLGLRSDGRADTNGAGFIGQVAAREVSTRSQPSRLVTFVLMTVLSLHRHAASSST